MFSTSLSQFNVRARSPPVPPVSDPTKQEVDVFEKSITFYEIMRSFLIILSFAVIWLTQQCSSYPAEETVVSVYTTHPTTSGTNPPIDVYHQIANNLAERITSPIYKFLGINTTKPEDSPKSGQKIELQDDPDLTSKHEVKPIDNDISKDRDVEEISVEALNKKADKKPEKITLYSSYLPVLAKASQASNAPQIEAKNDTWNELDDPFEWDDQESAKPKEGPFVYVLELVGSFIQLLWGGLMAIFRPSGTKS